MCRYSYRSGACANRLVDSLECVGEESCPHSEMNVLTGKSRGRRSGGCGTDRWLGLYCERYARFYCPGKDNCSTPEMYMRSFEAFRGPIRDTTEE